MTTHTTLPPSLPLRTPEPALALSLAASSQPNRGDLIHSALSSPLVARPPLLSARSFPGSSASASMPPADSTPAQATRPPLRSVQTSASLTLASSSPASGSAMELDGEGSASASGSGASGASGSDSSSVKKRRRTTPEELKILEDAYLVNNLPSSEERAALAERTGMGVRGVQIWFQNKRQTEKRKMHQQSMYPGVMLIPIHGGSPLPMPMGLPYPHQHGHGHAPYPMPSPGYAYIPSVLHPTPPHGSLPLPAPTPVRTHTTPAGQLTTRPALASVNPNDAAPARSRSTDEVGKARADKGKTGPHGEYAYAYAYAYAPTPGAPYPPHLHALPGMGHVRAAQAYAQQVQAGKAGQHRTGPMRGAAAFASSSERTRREAGAIESKTTGKDGYSSDSADASSPIKGGVPAQPLFRARVGSEGQAQLPRTTRSDSCASLPAPKPSLRGEHGLVAPRPIISRTQSARQSLSVRELAGLPTSRPRSSLGFDVVRAPSRGILDEMCTRRELPFPAPPSSPIKPLEGGRAGDDSSPMVTPARESASSDTRALRLAHLVSDPPSMEKPTTRANASTSDDSSSPGVATDRDGESDDERVAIAGGKGAARHLVDEDEDRPTLRRLASLDYYAGTPARRSMSVGLGAMRMGMGAAAAPIPAPLFLPDSRKLAAPAPTHTLKRRASEHDAEQHAAAAPRPRKARRSLPTEGGAGDAARKLPVPEPSARTERDEECARLLLGLGMFGA